MQALVADDSAVGRISLRDVPEPEPMPGQSLVDVRAISLNRGEWRALGSAPDGYRPGWDFAGIVQDDAQGRFPAGSRVVGILPAGAWAERLAVSHTSLAAIPDAVSFEQAAALPVAGLTALRTLRAGPLLGRRILITGASGGVGRAAVQLARLGGAEVTALVSGPHRAAGLVELGAHEVATDFGQLFGCYDLILESIGGDTLSRLLTWVDPEGTVVMYGNSSGEPTTFNVRDIYMDAAIRLQGFELFHAPAPFGRDLAYLAQLVADARLDPQVAGTLSWREMPSALELLGTRGLGGKVVLTVGN